MCDNEQDEEQVEGEQKQVKVEQEEEQVQEQECRGCAAQRVHACAVDNTTATDTLSPSTDTVNVPYRPQSPYGIPHGEDILDNPHLGPNEPSVQKKSDLQFDHMDFRTCLNQLSNGAAPGPDGIPAIILKRAKNDISLMLTSIFKSSYET